MCGGECKEGWEALPVEHYILNKSISCNIEAFEEWTYFL